MSRTVDASRLTGLASRFGAFVAERHPFALTIALEAFDSAGVGAIKTRDAVKLDAARTPFRRALAKALYDQIAAPEGIAETTPGTSAIKRLEQARAEVVDACDGFLRRAAIEASLTKAERKEILKGMCLTRSVDNRLKQFFMGGEVRWGDMAFQGKGFRSLGQEAIYAGAIRLHRGEAYRTADGTWRGDVLAPVIRDLGMTLAMRHDEEAVAMVLRAQMGKSGPPMDGKDLHTGDFEWGVLPAAAPLALGSLTMAGMAMAFTLEKSDRVAVSFIGDGGSSLGEWHEAINACAAAKLPAIFCVQNNQTALSTPVRDNSAARVFADKAAGAVRDARQRDASTETGGAEAVFRGVTDGIDIKVSGLYLGGGARARRRGRHVDRSSRHAHVRPRASRRHALPRQGPAAVVGVPPVVRDRLRQPRALRVLVEARPHPDVCPPARSRGRDQDW